ncbi:hypothetical protein K490DRAFT_52909 [Saccharata proteae CBS 121410]|uniref:Uncharacterized protein n=1 Tax=Saccharata proteae CBS 121410 TaxID=1314787 RepID=A0A9P4M010_9PEZI|nr:hypothetical protein K490DRAFT_52909 [Saccharata proteae CBS 121410]
MVPKRQIFHFVELAPFGHLSGLSSGPMCTNWWWFKARHTPRFEEWKSSSQAERVKIFQDNVRNYPHQQPTQTCFTKHDRIWNCIQVPLHIVSWPKPVRSATGQILDPITYPSHAFGTPAYAHISKQKKKHKLADRASKESSLCMSVPMAAFFAFL